MEKRSRQKRHGYVVILFHTVRKGRRLDCRFFIEVKLRFAVWDRDGARSYKNPQTVHRSERDESFQSFIASQGARCAYCRQLRYGCLLSAGRSKRKIDGRSTFFIAARKEGRWVVCLPLMGQWCHGVEDS